MNGHEVKGTSDGNGPVDASLKAIEAHVKSGAEMVLYSVNAISGSTESQGEVTVRLQNSGRVVNGVGSDPDIVVASAKAYLSALTSCRASPKGWLRKVKVRASPYFSGFPSYLLKFVAQVLDLA
jgi:2-isopropylmalate synthase